jgi:large subunit ribosomal protein L30
MSEIVIKQTRSLIGQSEANRKVVKALGLRRIGHSKSHKDNNCIRGMINKVKHLVSYELKG